MFGLEGFGCVINGLNLTDWMPLLIHFNLVFGLHCFGRDHMTF